MTARRKIPEIDLPPRLLAEITSYVGPKRMSELDSAQISALARAAMECAEVVSAVMRGRYGGGKKEDET